MRRLASTTVSLKMPSVGVLLGGANLLFCIAIIVLNKLYFVGPSKPFAVTLTTFHLLCTWFAMYVLKSMGHFHPIRLTRDILVLTVANTGFIVFNNLSLSFNSTSTYQVIKILTTPTILGLQFLTVRATCSMSLLIALVPIVIGVFAVTWFDVQLTVAGAIVGAVGMVSASAYQVYIKILSLPSAHPMALLHAIAPLSAAGSLVIAPFFDNWFGEGGMLVGGFSARDGLFFIVTGICAAGVNVSIFLFIRHMSPLSYNVLGHTKLIMIVLFGVFFFGEEVPLQKGVGLALTVLGVIAYTEFKRRWPEEARDWIRRSRTD